jgi:hypothetical protein
VAAAPTCYHPRRWRRRRTGTALQATPPDQYPGWQPPRPHTLPSGAVFVLQKPQIRKMIRRGQIPNPLMNIINEVFKERDELELATEAEAKGLTEDEVLEQRQAEAEAALEDPAKAPPIPKTKRERIEEAANVDMALQFRDVVVWASIVEPRVEIEPPVNGPLTASGALSYDALDEDDVNYIMEFANGDHDQIAPFPPDAERQDRGGDGSEVLDEAEPVAGHPA